MTSFETSLGALLDRAPPAPEPASGADPEDPAVSYAWLLAMAERTLAARPPSPAAELVRSLSRDLERRPRRDDALGQLHIDAASCLRRAERIRVEGPILAVGDDDGVTLALSLLGHTDAAAADLDERLLAFLAARGVETHHANFLDEAVPASLQRRFAAVVTDPFRDLDGGLGFLCFAAACIRDGGDLFWVDDPLWNPEHDAVRDAMKALGWRVVETHLDVHAYPLCVRSFVPDALIDALDLDAAWLSALIERTRAWSNLYRLRR